VQKKRIGILTGGGDCPGLNGVIRAVTKKAIFEYDMEVIGIEDGYEGLINKAYRPLSITDVSGIITLGGTILGTSNKANPYKYISNGSSTPKDLSSDVIATVKEIGLDCLVCIGGDGTLRIAHRLMHDGIPIVGVPKTIDNDIIGTDISFGFFTAVDIVTEGIDRLHTTAQSHHRVMVIEVMGRNAGWIALYSGIAGGGDIILLPEIPYDINVIADRVKERGQRGKRFSIVVVAEGAKSKQGEVVVSRMVADASEPVRLGGVGMRIAEQIEALTGHETRTVVMGHLQRGGSPNSFDRILATELGSHAVELIAAEKYGFMVGVRNSQIVDVPLDEVAKGFRFVPTDHSLIKAGLAVGASFGN
jgi:6-phosphofructokinase 1